MYTPAGIGPISLISSTLSFLNSSLLSDLIRAILVLSVKSASIYLIELLREKFPSIYRQLFIEFNDQYISESQRSPLKGIPRFGIFFIYSNLSTEIIVKEVLNKISNLKTGEYIKIFTSIECIPVGIYEIKEVNTKWLICKIEKEVLFGIRISALHEHAMLLTRQQVNSLTTADEFIRRHNTLLVEWIPENIRQLRPDTFCYIE